MLFNSFSFIIFFPSIFILYWFAFGKDLKQQNFLLLAASYFFYACWDWRFLFLLIFSTALDYFTGIKIYKSNGTKAKRYWITLSIVINVGFLAFFKYYNFFVGSFEHLISLTGFHIDTWTLKVILPIGISFYTFHGISYVIDIYKGKIKPENNFIDYSLFVSFFPLLVAGPIERATHLLPQIKEKRVFDYAKSVDGVRQILWGFFKKIVIADQCAIYVNAVFNNHGSYNAGDHVIAVMLFAFQIYCDFSGYSDIALGTARLLGIELLRNFAFPYFSRDIAEFWRRWHISLSSWFRDYLYIPLGGSRSNTVRNILIVFVVSGFWHGANWTFIFWGLLNALYILPLMLNKTNRDNLNFASAKDFFSIAFTFLLTCFAWIFFRSANLHNAFQFIGEIFSKSIFHFPTVRPYFLISLIITFIIIEWLGRKREYALAEINMPKFFRWVAYYVMIFLIFYFAGSEEPFIYFQF